MEDRSCGGGEESMGRVQAWDVSEFAHVKIPVSPSYLPAIFVLHIYAFKSLTATLVTSVLSSHTCSTQD